MSDFLTALVASAISAGAALAGVWVSNRNTRAGQREVLREESLNAQREMVSSVLLACREWASLQWLLVPIMSKMGMPEMTEFLNTDSGKRLAALVPDVKRNLTRGKLFLADDELRTFVIALDDFFENFAERVNGPILREQDKVEHVGNGLAEVRKFENTLDQFEREAIAKLRSPVN